MRVCAVCVCVFVCVCVCVCVCVSGLMLGRSMGFVRQLHVASGLHEVGKGFEGRMWGDSRGRAVACGPLWPQGTRPPNACA